jgi:hypothetical protein
MKLDTRKIEYPRTVRIGALAHIPVSAQTRRIPLSFPMKTGCVLRLHQAVSLLISALPMLATEPVKSRARCSLPHRGSTENWTRGGNCRIYRMDLPLPLAIVSVLRLLIFLSCDDHKEKPNLRTTMKRTITKLTPSRMRCLKQKAPRFARYQRRDLLQSPIVKLTICREPRKAVHRHLLDRERIAQDRRQNL